MHGVVLKNLQGSSPATLPSAGLIFDQIVLDEISISTPLSEPADINIAADGTLLVGIPSPVQGDEITLEARSNGMDDVFIGGDSAYSAQQVAEFSAGNLSGARIDLSVSGDRSVEFSLNLNSGNRVGGLTLSSGGTETVNSGSTAIGTVISGGGIAIIFSGGTAISTTLGTSRLAVLSVTSSVGVANGGMGAFGGTASGTTINSGGQEGVFSGPTFTTHWET